MSYKADPKAEAVDSFIVSWHSLNFYAFSPFSVISRTLKKTKAEKAQSTLVVLYWPNQAWFPVLFKILIDTPLLITSWKSSETAKVSKTGAPQVEENRYGSMSLSRFIGESNGISKQAQDILEASWRPSTKKRYAGHVQ